MRCIIRIVDGQPFEHPIMIDNFRQAFPDIDINAPLPDGFAWFDRKLRPQIQEHEVFVNEHAYYEWDGTIWTDVWRVRDKTEDELRVEVADAYDFLRTKAANAIASLSDDAEGIAAWTAFVELVDARHAENPMKIKPPRLPYKNEDGVWISVNNPGSTPNVIG